MDPEDFFASSQVVASADNRVTPTRPVHPEREYPAVGSQVVSGFEAIGQFAELLHA